MCDEVHYGEFVGLVSVERWPCIAEVLPCVTCVLSVW